MKCKYCEKDGYYEPNKYLIDREFEPNKYLIDREFETEEDYHWINLMINCKDKQIVCGVDNNIKFNEVITKKINYCPICGRKLD